MHVSIIIPTYESAAWISNLIAEIKENSPADTEIIIVDDSPMDYINTENLKLAGPEIVYARHHKNYGEQMALYTGLHLAQGKTIVMMDDDFECLPTILPELINKTTLQESIVYVQFKRSAQNRIRRLGSFLFNRLLAAFSGRPDLYLSSFKSFSRDIADGLLLQPNPFYILDRNLFELDAKLKLLPGVAGNNIRGRSNYTFFGLVRYFLTSPYRRLKSQFPIQLRVNQSIKDRLNQLPTEQQKRFSLVDE